MKFLKKPLLYTLLFGIVLIGYNIKAKTDITIKKMDELSRRNRPDPEYRIGGFYR